MALFPFISPCLPGCDPTFSEINQPSSGYYEVGGISKHNSREYYHEPYYTGTLKEIARKMFIDLTKQNVEHKLYAGLMVVSFYPKTKCEYSIAAIPCSQDGVDTDQFLIDITAELDKIRILLPFW